jgi:acetoin utilization deacetylase AcuC-like enzyme
MDKVTKRGDRMSGMITVLDVEHRRSVCVEISRGRIVDPRVVREFFDVQCCDELVFTDKHGLDVFGLLEPGQTYVLSCGQSCGTTVEGVEGYFPLLNRVGFFFGDGMLAHEPPAGTRSPEDPVRLSRLSESFESDPLIGKLPSELRFSAVPALPQSILAVHGSIEGYEDFLNNGVVLPNLPSDVYCTSKSAESALLACGSVIEAARLAVNGTIDHAYCAVRPPGHHCGCYSTRGFCLINNVAVAAKTILAEGSIRKLAIVDIDVHHGDGTQSIAERDSRILFMSVHRYDAGTFFPFSKERGSASYVGPHKNIINIPFDTSAHIPEEAHRVISDTTFREVRDRIILPELGLFSPEMVFVSCGFDAAYGDPLGKMAVCHGYFDVLYGIARWAAQNKSTRGPIPVIAVLEGGYHPSNVADGSLQVMRALLFGGSAHDFDNGDQSSNAEAIRHQIKQWASPRTPPTWEDAFQRQQKRIERKTMEEPSSNGADAHDRSALLARHIQWVDDSISQAIELRSTSLNP